MENVFLWQQTIFGGGRGVDSMFYDYIENSDEIICNF
jgi:hypothetical protein